MIDGLNLLTGEEFGEDPLHDLAVFENIAHPAWAAGVIFEDEVLTGAIANEVAPADMDVDIFWNVKTDKFRAEMFGGFDYFFGNDAFFYNSLVVVNITEEEI